MTHGTANLEDTVRKAEAAKRLLEDAGVQAIFAAERDRIIKEWETAKTTAAREEQHAALQALHKLQVHLKTIKDRGEHAQIEANRVEARSRA